MAMKISRTKRTPGIAFRYGDRLLLETFSSNISAVDFHSSSKSVMQINFNILKHGFVLNPKSGVYLGLYGRHLEKKHGVITPRQVAILAVDSYTSFKFGLQRVSNLVK